MEDNNEGGAGRRTGRCLTGGGFESRTPKAPPSDADLLDALEYYAWRVWQADGQPWTIKVDAHGGAVLGEGATVREALTRALEAVCTTRP